MKLVFSLVLFLQLSVIMAQAPEAFVRTYGSNDFNYGKGILTLPDTSYIIAGNRSFNGSLGSIWLFRVDSMGAIMWEYYVNYFDAVVVEDIAWYNDTSFIICGTALQNNDYQIYTARFSINGDKIWEKTLGSPAWDYGKALVSDSAYHIYISGFSLPYDTLDKDAVIYKIDGLNGDSLMHWRLDFDYSDEATYIDTISSYLLLTTQTTDINSDSTCSTIWYMNKDLSVIWSISFGNDSVDYYLNCTANDPYSRIMIGGSYKSDTAQQEMYYMATVNSSGILFYERMGDVHGNRFITRFAVDSTFRVCAFGSTVSDVISFGNSDFGIVYDSIGFGGLRYYGATQNDYGEDIANAVNGGVVMLGSTENYASNASSILLIKVSRDLSFYENDYAHFTDIPEMLADFNISAYPNPSRAFFQIDTKFEFSHFEVFDAYGRSIANGNNIPEMIINLEHEANGIYYLSLFANNEIRTIKLFLQK